jgi:hypothetical protein
VKKEKEEKIIEYFERDWVVLTIHLILTVVLCYLCYYYISIVSPIGFVIGVPASIVSFQTLWIVLNPYALVYDNRIEIKSSIFGSKTWYLIDIQKVSEENKKTFSITYNDEDTEKIKCYGIRSSQSKKFRDCFNHYVCKSLVERED